jgi:hypothetical protein
VCDAEVPERIGPGQQIAGLLRERVGLLELQNRSVLLTPDHLVHDADPEARLHLAANVGLVGIQQRGALASTPSSPRSASASPLGLHRTPHARRSVSPFRVVRRSPCTRRYAVDMPPRVCC